MNSIADNLARIHETIAAAARQSGRRPEDIKLIAVSKTHPPETIDAAVRAGQRLFGENTIQEALTKIPSFAGRDLEWHFIGHLQSNKAKFIPGNFTWVHSLDDLKLAQRLSRVAQDKHGTVHSLIEVNVTGDPNKHGVAPSRLLPLLDELAHADLPGIRLRGLMTIGPYPASERERRVAFEQLRELRDGARERFSLPDLTELSMGMSGDYADAIAEGSTMVRIGTAIFGERSYT